MADNRKEQIPTQGEYQSVAGCLPRLFWMAFGNIALVAAALAIYKSTGWSIADLAFLLIVGLLIGARYIDMVRYRGTTADGQPATRAHLKRYVLWLLVTALVLWVVTHALGPGFP